LPKDGTAVINAAMYAISSFLLLLLAPAGILHGLPGAVFLSPMGEPFRSGDPAEDLVGTWFRGADRDADGRISPAEMEADAARFFASLDSDSDGEIGPAEMARYEEATPEVQLGLQMRNMGPDWRRRRERRHNPRPHEYDEGIEGAGRYSFLDIPQPVMQADSDLNRGVSRAEFIVAAGQRFGLLDKDDDGSLTRAELPPLPQPKAHPRRYKEGEGRWAPIPKSD
jgi:Ca2+-binding EF-hand superfamily protein